MTIFRLDGSVKIHPSTHNHPTDLSSIEAAKTFGEIEYRAILTDETQQRRHGGSIGDSVPGKLLSRGMPPPDKT